MTRHIIVNCINPFAQCSFLGLVLQSTLMKMPNLQGVNSDNGETGVDRSGSSMVRALWAAIVGLRTDDEQNDPVDLVQHAGGNECATEACGVRSVAGYYMKECNGIC